MKKLSILTLLAVTFFAATAQQDVYLKINHKLGAANFSFNQTTTNNLSNSFNFDRLEYYIAEITLRYDGGQDTTLDTYILVDAGTTTNQLLGTFNITSLESISFGVGVNTPYNNDDPNLWPANHPLAPKSPSMHWGWAAGYRFAAVEGKTGSNMTNIWQIHALGNRNYTIQTIPTTGLTSGNNTTIELDADYTQAMKNITVNGNLITHGEIAESVTLLNNFANGVFTNGPVGIRENKLMNFAVSPNPSPKDVLIQFEENQNGNELILTSLNGQVISREIITSGNQVNLSIGTKGTYLANIYKEGNLIGSQKVIIK
tara:strand:+ start:175 stop:1119 length:945 start_codon:yes stop_codon:yes gene_type:complete